MGEKSSENHKEDHNKSEEDKPSNDKVKRTREQQRLEALTKLDAQNLARRIMALEDQQRAEGRIRRESTKAKMDKIWGEIQEYASKKPHRRENQETVFKSLVESEPGTSVLKVVNKMKEKIKDLKTRVSEYENKENKPNPNNPTKRTIPPSFPNNSRTGGQGPPAKKPKVDHPSLSKSVNEPPKTETMDIEDSDANTREYSTKDHLNNVLPERHAVYGDDYIDSDDDEDCDNVFTQMLANSLIRRDLN